MGDAVFWESGKIRKTPFREQVFALLCQEGSPMTHNQILDRLSQPADRVTLYRTLEALRQAGMLHQVQGADGVWRFCAHSSRAQGCPGNHPHFMCVACGVMLCLCDQPMQRVVVPEEVEVFGKQLIVYGHCAACRASKQERRGDAGAVCEKEVSK